MTREKLPLRVAEVVRGDLISQISTNGKVEPQINFEAHSPIAATVRNLFVHEGDKVPAGKLLLELMPPMPLARLAAAATAVKGAQATYDAMKRGGTQEERLSLAGDLSKAKIERDNAAQCFGGP